MSTRKASSFFRQPNPLPLIQAQQTVMLHCRSRQVFVGPVLIALNHSGARKGLYIVDLQNPYDPPRFLPHNSAWEVADVQWNPFPARSEWVASTVSYTKFCD